MIFAAENWRMTVEMPQTQVWGSESPIPADNRRGVSSVLLLLTTLL
jgi:hypothetical protein